MRCPRALELISVRVDGRSPSGTESRRLDEHIARCPSCRHVLVVETERAVLLDRALWAEGEECDLLASRIVEAARHPSEVWRQRWDSRRFSLLAPLAFSAALGLVLGMGSFWWWLSHGPRTMGGGGSKVAERESVPRERALPVRALEGFQVLSEEELWDAQLEPEGSGRGIRWSTKTIDLDPAVYEKVPRGDRAARLYLELERIDNFRLERDDNFRFAKLQYR